MTTVEINLPDDLLEQLGADEAQRLAHTHLVVTLFERGIISSGRVADLLGVSRREGLDLLGERGLSIFDDTDDLAAEVRQTWPLTRFEQSI